MTQAHIVRVLIASPGDCHEERAGLVDAIQFWNVQHADEIGVYLWPWMWETCSVASYGQDGQAELNQQLVEKADACVAFFRKRIGSGTPRAESGTVEEIEGAADRGLRPGVHFLDDGQNAEGKDAEKLRDYKQKLQGSNRYYYVSYSSVTGGVSRALASAVSQAKSAVLLRTDSENVNFDMLDDWSREAAAHPTDDLAKSSAMPSLFSSLSRMYWEIVTEKDDAANRDWSLTVNDMETGWDLTNISKLPLRINSYKAVVLDEDSDHEREIWEDRPQVLVLPGETIEIQPSFADDSDIYLAKLETSYHIGNHHIEASIKNSSNLPEPSDMNWHA